MLLAQEFQGVGGEINDQQAAALGHQPRGLAHGRSRVGEIVQDLVDHDEIGAVRRQPGAEDVAVAQFAALKTSFGHVTAGDVQHLLRQV